MDKKTTLFLHKICPFAQRAWITLLEKKIQHSLTEVSLTNKQPFFTQTYHKAYAHDPKSDGKVPILVDDGKTITESDLICWYLSEKYNTGTQLIPKDPFERLKLRHFLQTQTKIIGAFYGFIGWGKKQQQDKEKHLKVIETLFQDLQNNLVLPYAMGEDFTLADIFIYPWFARWVALQNLVGSKIDPKFKKIHEWVTNIQGRDSVKSTRQSNQFYTEGYKSYF